MIQGRSSGVEMACIFLAYFVHAPWEEQERDSGPDSETLSGTINTLYSDRYTDIGEGATYPEHLAIDVVAWAWRLGSGGRVAAPHYTPTEQR
jgi:hypothetical protein